MSEILIIVDALAKCDILGKKEMALIIVKETQILKPKLMERPRLK